MALSGQAMRVEANWPNLMESPEIVTLPVKRLQEAFPAARPASRKDREALEFGTTGVPARSLRSHSIPESAAGSDGDGELFIGLWFEQEPIKAKKKTSAYLIRVNFILVILWHSNFPKLLRAGRR